MPRNCHCEHAALTDANIAFAGYCRWRFPVHATATSHNRNCISPSCSTQQQPPRELLILVESKHERAKGWEWWWPRPGPPSGPRGKAETGEGCWEVHQHPTVSHLSCHVCYAGVMWPARRLNQRCPPQYPQIRDLCWTDLVCRQWEMFKIMTDICDAHSAFFKFFIRSPTWMNWYKVQMIVICIAADSEKSDKKVIKRPGWSS